MINLVNIRISSLNCKQQVPCDLPTHGHFEDSSQLKSQQYLYRIYLWTDAQHMIISDKKTKSMIVNFTDKFKFHTRLQQKGKSIEVVEKTLSWDENCANIIKKVNARLQLIRKVWSFGSSLTEMVQLWKVFCRSIQSCVLWDSGLTQENRTHLQRTQ